MSALVARNMVRLGDQETQRLRALVARYPEKLGSCSSVSFHLLDRDDLFFEFYDLFLPSNGVLGMPYLHLGRSDAGEDISDLLLMLLNVFFLVFLVSGIFL